MIVAGLSAQILRQISEKLIVIITCDISLGFDLPLRLTYGLFEYSVHFCCHPFPPGRLVADWLGGGDESVDGELSIKTVSCFIS